ncbi:MAG TPA: hypothetical protein VMF11_06535 [Candidatus Baltobacteraceae bacterium]|nr:hypothetical protein [Candidatus Baltobacteraceae bacterium]
MSTSAVDEDQAKEPEERPASEGSSAAQEGASRVAGGGDDGGSVTYPRTDGTELDEDVRRTAEALGLNPDLLRDYADLRILTDENLAAISYAAIQYDLAAAVLLISQLEALLASPEVMKNPRLAGAIIEALRRARLAAYSHQALASRKSWAEQHLFDTSRSHFAYAMPASAARNALDEVLARAPLGRTSSGFRGLVEDLGMEGGSCYIGWMIGKPLDAQSLVSFTGRNTFNGFYFDHEIRSVQVLEAKGGGSHLGYAAGLRQGTQAYFGHILSRMESSPDSRRRAEAQDLIKAYKDGYDVRYVGVRTTYATGSEDPTKVFDSRITLAL